MKNLEATKLVRKVISSISILDTYSTWTNKFNACRTVKTYWNGDQYPVEVVQARLDAVFGPDSGITAKVVTHSCSYRPAYITTSLIVRVPYDKFPN